MDFANRLPRGAHLRGATASVVDLAIARGKVAALVAGSELYTVTVRIAQMKRARWRGRRDPLRRAGSGLWWGSSGELSAEVLAVLADAKEGLFPEPREDHDGVLVPGLGGMCNTWQRSCTAWARASTRGPSCSSPCAQVDQTSS